MNPLNALKLMNSKEPFTQEERFFKPCSFSILETRFGRTSNCLKTSLIEFRELQLLPALILRENYRPLFFYWILIIAYSDLSQQTNNSSIADELFECV